jgi:LCP family protein required for cell wall assembly
MPPLWGSASKAGFALSCVAAALLLVISGFSYFLLRDVAGIGGSHAIASGPSIGAQNILLMGLESRTDWNGNVLSPDILAAMHAGSVRGVLAGVGGNDTNTLILLHISAGGTRVTGFSIPRDDWVSFAGTIGPQQQGKIDQAYGVSMYYEQAGLRTSRLSQDQIAYQGNEAGRAATVATVEQLTGVQVDHFAEINMVGFYELAKVLGGVYVCLRHPVRDPYSGADFPAGYQHLAAAQALAFVRQRHGLPGGDLDRTRRQQAFLSSVIHQLRAQGVLSDLTKIQAMLSVAQRYVITDSGWNLTDFAAQMRTLDARDLDFRTLPISGYGVMGGQDVNIIDPARIKSIVHDAFYPTTETTRTATTHREPRRPAGARPRSASAPAADGVPCVS